MNRSQSTMLQLSKISYQIEGNLFLKNINWVINSKKRVALIGANGAGKTTLLRLIAGERPLQEGEIIKAKTFQIGYLPQEEINFGQEQVLEEVLKGRDLIQQIEREKDSIRLSLKQEDIDSDQQKTLVAKLGELETQYDILGGYTYQAKAKKILMGLGFQENEFKHPISSKSGGWRMRVYLARLLLQDPDLLLLDEPTNHLDLESLEWLEAYLLDFSGSMIIVSHDRFFVDRLADEITELENGVLRHYPGKYAFYEKKKALYLQQSRQQAQQVQAEKERLSRFINRFRYKASKAPQVQDRIKRLAKLEEVEIPKSSEKINFKIVCPHKSYKDVCALDRVGFKYNQEWIFQNVDLTLFRGQKAALVGINGAGKTTLTKLIAGQLSPLQGKISIGQNVSIGYYAQHQIDALNTENTILEEVSSVAADMYRTRIKDILGLFKFSNDDIHKKIAVISGGEKARVSLAKILLSPVNFLLMDEPTNHLDNDSKMQLEKALQAYDGTLLIISHDRYFLDKLVSIVFELKNRHLQRFEGNYSDYLRKRNAWQEQSNSRTENEKSIVRRDKVQKRAEAEARQKISRRRKELNQQINQLECELEKLETEQIELEQSMSDTSFYQDQDRAAQTGKRYQDLRRKIPVLYQRWEEKQTELEQLLAELKNE